MSETEYNICEYLCGNKYHAKTETQYKFSERVEKELGYICNFDNYVITRGRGWSKSDGSCGSSVELQNNILGYPYLLLYYPLRTYLNKNIELEVLKEYSSQIGLFIKVKEKKNERNK